MLSNVLVQYCICSHTWCKNAGSKGIDDIDKAKQSAWCNTKNMTPLVWHNISHISSKYGSLQPISSLVAIIRVVLCKVPFWRATESLLEGWLEKGFSLSRRLDIYVKKVIHNAWRAKKGKREGGWRCISISLETMFQ